MSVSFRTRLRVAGYLEQLSRLRAHSAHLLVLLVALLFFLRLGHRELYSSHEARAAQNAQRMLDTGVWGLPILFDGQTDLQKPPGYYWLVAIVGTLNGGEVNSWVARIPPALAGLLTVVLVFAFLRREGRPVAALVAAGALATAIHFTAIARTARIDVPLTCAVTASLLAFWRGSYCSCFLANDAEGDTSPDRRREQYLPWHILAAACAAAAVMLKGPIGLALIGPVAVSWLLVRPKPSHINRRALPIPSLLLCPLIVAALSLPWFVWANHVTNGEFARVFFWHHNIERFTGTSSTLASHPWWYYAPRFFVDFLPWTPVLVYLCVWAIRNGRWHDDRHLRLGLVWFVVMVAILSLAKFKRADYLLPAFPGAAIALGCAAEAWLASRTRSRTIRNSKRGFGLTLAAVGVGWLVMTFVIEPAEQRREEKRAFADMIRSHAPRPQEILMFRAESHLLAFHLGRSLYTLVEWGELNNRMARPGPHFVVMPPEYVYPAERIVTSRRLVVVARLDDYTPDKPPRPLVFLRTAD